MVKGKSLISYVHLFIVACAIVVIALVISPVFAESIFLKDGSIIEGDIVKETDKAMEVKLSDGKKMSIQRKDILRTLVSTTYKTKMYIMKNDKTVLLVYIVEEDNEKYVCRKDLYSANEFAVNKDEVIFISKVAPDTIISDKGKEKNVTSYSREQNITWRAPLLRIGYAPKVYSNDTLEYLYPEYDVNLFLDFFPIRFRNESGNGYDVMMRMRVYGRKAGRGIPTTDERTPKFEQLFLTTISNEYGSDYFFISGCFGLRYAYGKYYLGLYVQPYIFGLY